MQLEKLGKLGSRTKYLTEADIEHMVKLRDEGYTLNDIAMAYQRSREKVSQYCSLYRKGIVIHEQFVERKFDYGKLRALMNAGWNYFKLMSEFGLDGDELKERIKELKQIEKGKVRC